MILNLLKNLIFKKANYSTKSNRTAPVLLLDNSDSRIKVKNENGLFQIFDFLYLNENFTANLTDILEELYDNNNNKNTSFTLYFIRTQPNIIIDIPKLLDHFSKFPTISLRIFKTKAYKNTGLIYSTEVLVFWPFYDIENLKKISNNIKNEAISNIEDINNSFQFNQNNTIQRVYEKFNFNDKLLLMIHADYNKIKNN